MFVTILKYAKDVGRCEFKRIAIDGTKIKANANKLKNHKIIKTENNQGTDPNVQEIAEIILSNA